MDLPNETDRKREEARHAVVRATGLVDTPPEEEFEAVVALATELTGCRAAAITLVDADRLWFKAETGLGGREMAREHAFCSIAVDRDELYVIDDAAAHPRFHSYPQVVGGPKVRFYAGMPIHARTGADAPAIAVGTLCLIDSAPRELDDRGLQVLRRLALLVEKIIAGRFVAAKAAELVASHEAANIRLTRAHRNFQQAERLVDLGSWRLTLADQQLEWSEGVFAVHGLPIGDAPKLDAALTYYPPQSRAIITALVERAMADGTPWDVEVDFLPVGGDLRRVRAIGECEVIGGVPVALTGVFQDVTERHLAEQALRRTASVDELTGLANRAAFNAALDERIAQARARDETFALGLIDLDGFKAVNDRCGHLRGDEVLQAVAERLDRAQRLGLWPARLGGDEFVLMLDDPPGSTAFHATVEALLASLRMEVPHEHGSLKVSGTMGITWFDGASTRRDMLNRADQALYAAKRDCPGTARMFGSEFVFGEDDADSRRGDERAMAA